MKWADSLKDNLPRLTQEKKKGNFNSPISIKVSQNLVSNSLPKENLGIDGFTKDFYQTFKEEITQFLHKLF